MKTTLSAFDQAIRSHDDLIKRRALTIWIGAEPTFTDRHSEAAEWLCNALGPTKEMVARRMLAACYARTPGAVVLRTLGRQYPKESRPRWSLGLYQRRDGQSIWSGPPDPLVNAFRSLPSASQWESFLAELTRQLHDNGWPATLFTVDTLPQSRILFRRDNLPLRANPVQEPRLLRPCLHNQPISPQGLRDDLAEQGDYLLALDQYGPETGFADTTVPVLELPACKDSAFFLSLLKIIGDAARLAELPALVLNGFPPPVDATVAWTTLTPDPAVIEANMAPMPDAATFLRENRNCFNAATTVGLSPYRLHYNGQIADSGGGGQITLGGPHADSSPFLLYPHLLPALISYFNHHPALSYYFAGDFVGNSSQAPRPDERTTDIFAELTLALVLLKRQRNPSPELLWQTLSPFLADPAGNTHRTEINIEKLWNPYLPGRGQLGLVEFRAFRMPPSPERLAALAAMLRAITAMLVQTPDYPEPIHWGRELHDRFALPYYLRADLWEILDELASAGLGLGQPLIAELLDETHFWLGMADAGDCRLTVRRALEFWPLLGDALSQEHGNSRLVDASTARLEISLSATPEVVEYNLADCSVTVNGYRLPLRQEKELRDETWLCGLRYRRFKPWTGLHQTLEPQGPLELVLTNPHQSQSLRITLQEWRPQGGSYEGLPKDLADAAARRAERFHVKTLATLPPEPLEPPSIALTPHCLDLRYL